MVSEGGGGKNCGGEGATFGEGVKEGATLHVVEGSMVF